MSGVDGGRRVDGVDGERRVDGDLIRNFSADRFMFFNGEFKAVLLSLQPINS
ncbi:hypothetical protein JCM15548_13557 [Geofilum rubicundum JCM 15548]|uniref:Uncharacterized protein n=1 Tax=Geofilum rubicundum JCM 15548 TaxID=1236989 RepID=A0A0E9M260_9BACT|nr:hypothetical protein JCM15548_13557 [Geofilum rubicundum JCM 15548]